MAALQEVIRKISIVASAVGLDGVAAGLDRLAGAQANVTVATATTEKATLSMQSKLLSLQRTLDVEFRAEEKLAAIQKTLSAARAQGLVSLAEENRLLDLAATKYKVAGESAVLMGEGMKVAKEAAMGLMATLGPIAGIAVLAELPGKIMEGVKSGAELKNMAETIGTTTDKLQELQYAAKLTDVSTDMMNTALEKFSKNLGMAATGSGELAKILKINHVAITGDLMTDFENFANLIQHATNSEQKNLLVTAAFGKNAQELGRIFNDGADGVKRLGDEAQNTGVILSDQILDKAEKLNQEFVKTQAQLGTTFEEFLISAGPSMVSILTEIAKEIKDWRDLLHDIGNFDWSKLSFIKHEDPNWAIDWLGNGSMVTGNRALVKTANDRGAKGSDRDGSAPDNSVTNLGDLSFLHPAKPTKSPTTATPESPFDKVTAALRLQKDALTQTNREAFISQQLSQAKVTDASKEGRALEKLAGQYYDQKQAIDAANQAAQFMGQTVESAFEGILDGSTSVVQAMENVAKAIGQAALQSLLLGQGPLAGIFGTAPSTSGGLGGLFGQLFKPHALGGVMAGAGISAYSGSIVDRPTVFPFASGIGLMGEAGAEAILPLKRGTDGKLGVAANQNGAAPVQIEVMIGVDQSGNLKAFVQQTAGQAANVVVRQAVPGMIKAGAGPAIASASRDKLLNHK